MTISRKSFIVRSGSLIAAAGAPFALSPDRLLAAVSDSAESGEGVTSITAVSASGVRVANREGLVPTDGFPDGWIVEVGDHVAVLSDPSSTEVRAFPVAHWVDRVIEPAQLSPGALIAEDRSLKLGEGAVLVGDPQTVGVAKPAHLCLVDRDTGPGPERVISVRW
jgi:hypothetical protein